MAEEIPYSEFSQSAQKAQSYARLEMEKKIQEGRYKRGAAKATDEIALAGLLIDEYAVDTEINQVSSQVFANIIYITGVEGKKPEDFDFRALALGFNAFGHATGTEKKNPSDEERKALEYFKKEILTPILNKNGISETEFKTFAAAETNLFNQLKVTYLKESKS